MNVNHSHNILRYWKSRFQLGLIDECSLLHSYLINDSLFLVFIFFAHEFPWILRYSWEFLHEKHTFNWLMFVYVFDVSTCIRTKALTFYTRVIVCNKFPFCHLIMIHWPVHSGKAFNFFQKMMKKCFTLFKKSGTPCCYNRMRRVSILYIIV